MTVTPNGSPFLIQIGGVWLDLPGVLPGTGVGVARPSSSTISLGGTVRTQQAKRSSRTWTFGFGDETAEALRWLQYAVTAPGDVFLYDIAAAQVNMLDPLDCYGRSLTEGTIQVEGLPMRILPNAYTFTVKVRAGATYWFGGTTTVLAGNTLGTYKIGVASTVNIVAPTGTLERSFSTSFVPTVDADVVFTLVAGFGVGTSALRLTEGAVDEVGFIPGQKSPCQVSVDDPQYTMNLAYPDQLAVSDYTVTIREVG